MTYNLETTKYRDVLELLNSTGFSGMRDALELLFNEAMKIERSIHLGANPHERTESGAGYANGFKPKTVQTRVGELKLDVPQTNPWHEFLPRWPGERHPFRAGLALSFGRDVRPRRIYP